MVPYPDVGTTRTGRDGWKGYGMAAGVPDSRVESRLFGVAASGGGVAVQVTILST